MPRQYLLIKTPQSELVAVNDVLVAIFGDDPGTMEFSMAAYLDGEDPEITTHWMCNINCAQAQVDYLVGQDGVSGYLYSKPGVAGLRYPIVSPAHDSWAEALANWGLKPVAPTGP